MKNARRMTQAVALLVWGTCLAGCLRPSGQEMQLTLQLTPEGMAAETALAEARETIAERLEEAGFVDYDVAAVDFTTSYRSLDDWWASTQDMSMRFADATAGMDAGTTSEIQAALAEAAAPYTDGDGAIALPARTWTAVATA